MGPALKGLFSKEKRTSWKNHLCSKSFTSFAKDDQFLLGLFADKIFPFKNGKIDFLFFKLFETGFKRTGVNGAAVNGAGVIRADIVGLGEFLVEHHSRQPEPKEAY